MQVITNEKWLSAVSGGQATIGTPLPGVYEAGQIGSAAGGGSDSSYGGSGGGYGSSGGAQEPGLGFVMPSPATYAFILGTWIGSKLNGK